MARKSSKAEKNAVAPQAPANGDVGAATDVPVAAKAPAAKKKKSGSAKKTAAKSASKPRPAKKTQARTAEPSDDEIRLRAYFIAESRSQLFKPGDETTDWLEAKRQLFAEAGLPIP